MSLPVGNAYLEYTECYKASASRALTRDELSRFNTLRELHQQTGGEGFWNTESGRELSALHHKIRDFVKARYPDIVARRSVLIGKEMEFVAKAWEDVMR